MVRYINDRLPHKILLLKLFDHNMITFNSKIMAILEVWQRGPVDGIPPLLQPVAHALLQAREEIAELSREITDEILWKRPAGVASAGFHLQHLSGVLDRVFTYARNEMLSEKQLIELATEDISPNPDLSVAGLISRFNNQVDIAMMQLNNTKEDTLTEPMPIGRKRLPTTVIGLLVHAAEHTMRHLGQLRVTVKILVNAQTGI